MKEPEKVEVLALGSGSEVGRSCVIATLGNKRIMFDCGIHPARTGFDSLPQFDSIDCSTIDVALITHFHLDHCGAVPYLCAQTNFTGRIFMTHPTKAIYRKIMQDFARLNGSESVITEEWIDKSMTRIETIDFHQEEYVNGISIKPYNAGHVLGAAMFFVEIMGVKIMYTGDYSRYPDRHLLGAETPAQSPDVLILESTYGIQVHESQKERESKFVKWAHDIVRAPRNGKCLIPVFALGRAQELLLVLEDYWAKHKELHNVPIYFISSMSAKFDELYDYYKYQLNEEVQEEERSPFAFKHIICKKDLRDFSDIGPCVVLASPGMLQTGVSRDLFERWCTEMRNGVIIAGYCVEGTLAKSILDRPREIQREDGKLLPLRMDSIHNVSFSAHSDFAQTKDFISSIPQTREVVLVHGNPDAVSKLSERLMSDFEDRKLKTYIAINSQAIKIAVQSKVIANICGTLAEKIHDQKEHMILLLVSKVTGEHIAISPEDISNFTDLDSAALNFGLHIKCPAHLSIQNLSAYLAQKFEHCSLENTGESPAHILVDRSIEIRHCPLAPLSDDQPVATVQINWKMPEPHALVRAQAVCVYCVEYIRDLYSPARMNSQEIAHKSRDRREIMQAFLRNTFQNVTLDSAKQIFTVDYMGVPNVSIDANSLDVTGGTQFIRERIGELVQRFAGTRGLLSFSE